MASLVGGIGISHTPLMGVEYDRAMQGPDGFSAPWKVWFEGTRRVQEIVEQLAPQHLIVVYNDHFNYFDLDNYPMLAIGVGARYRQTDEGWGQRDLPDLEGDIGWGLHLTEQLVAGEFDLTVSHELAIDHGIFSWLPDVLRRPWPVTITPIAVNMIRQPFPTPNRLKSLGRALRECVDSYPAAGQVMIIATGGMSHQLSGARFGIANESFDRYFLRMLPDHLDELAAIPLREYMRVGGTEAAELALWFTMRAALSDRAREAYGFQTFPALTGCGALVMVEPGALARP
jgi:hypothetical protein